MEPLIKSGDIRNNSERREREREGGKVISELNFKCAV
jgi:hypothetical protein